MSWVSFAPHPRLALLRSGSHQLRSPELLGNSPIQSTMHTAVCNTNTLSSFILIQTEPVRLTVSSSRLSPPSWLLQSPPAEPGRLLYLTLVAGHLCSCSSRALPLLFFLYLSCWVSNSGLVGARRARTLPLRYAARVCCLNYNAIDSMSHIPMCGHTRTRTHAHTPALMSSASCLIRTLPQHTGHI